MSSKLSNNNTAGTVPEALSKDKKRRRKVKTTETPAALSEKAEAEVVAAPEAAVAPATKKPRVENTVADTNDTANNVLQDLKEGSSAKGSGVSLLEQYDRLMETHETLNNCLRMLNSHLKNFRRQMVHHEREQKKTLGRLERKQNTRKPSTKPRKASGFRLPKPLPAVLLPFVDQGRDPTKDDNLVPKTKNPSEGWWETSRWVNTANNTCWRLESNEPGDAKWVKCEQMEMARPQISSILCKYANDKGLKDKDNKTLIYPDKKLAKLLGDPRYPLKPGKDGDKHGYSVTNLASYVRDLFDAKK